jgi:hypothetical protein
VGIEDLVGWWKKVVMTAMEASSAVSLGTSLS